MFRNALRPLRSAAPAPARAALRVRNSSTTPQPPPKPTPFFAPSKIGIEVTPLIAFVGTLLTIAAGAGIHHLMKDDDLRLKPGESPYIEHPDDQLAKVLAQPGSAKGDDKKDDKKDKKE